MVSCPGSTRLSLFLLCCMGTLLSIHMAAIGCLGHRHAIIKELQKSSKTALENYNQTGLQGSPNEQLSFASYCQQPDLINSSAILPYFTAIKSFWNKTDIDNIIQQLKKLKCSYGSEVNVTGPEVSVTAPTEEFKQKWFTLTILQEFFTCMESLKPAPTGSSDKLKIDEGLLNV